MINITINRPPYSSPRPRARNTGKFTQIYMPSEYMKEKKIIQDFLKPHIPKGFELMTGPLRMDITFYMSIPKSYSTKKHNELLGTLHFKKPDRDNLLKTYQDALEGLIYLNDAQVGAGAVNKIYSDNPRVEIKIKEL